MTEKASTCTPRNGFVLVVDDDTDLRETIEVLLSARGHQVVAAGDGAEALAWLKKNPDKACLVLLDLMMPGMDGFTFYALTSADPILASIPIVVITGAGVMADARSAELPREVLRKPISFHALVQTVSRFCSPQTASPSN